MKKGRAVTLQNQNTHNKQFLIDSHCFLATYMHRGWSFSHTDLLLPEVDRMLILDKQTHTHIQRKSFADGHKWSLNGHKIS